MPLLTKQDGGQPGRPQRQERDQWVGDAIDSLQSVAPLTRGPRSAEGKDDGASIT